MNLTHFGVSARIELVDRDDYRVSSSELGRVALDVA